MDVAGVDENDVARTIQIGCVIDLKDAFSSQIQKDLEVVMKMVLDELDLVDEHLDVFDLRVLDDLNTTAFHRFKKIERKCAINVNQKTQVCPYNMIIYFLRFLQLTFFGQTIQKIDIVNSHVTACFFSKKS